eukprot:s3529_g1.t1
MARFAMAEVQGMHQVAIRRILTSDTDLVEPAILAKSAPVEHRGQSSLRSDSQKENTQREVDPTELRGPWQVRVLKRSAVVRHTAAFGAQPLPDSRGTVDVPWVLGRALKALQGPTWRLLLDSWLRIFHPVVEE